MGHVGGDDHPIISGNLGPVISQTPPVLAEDSCFVVRIVATPGPG